MENDREQLDPQNERARADRLELRAIEAEARSTRYRQAFLGLLEERFDDLQATVRRMLEVLATTLDVGRVSFWVFEDERRALRCIQLHDPASAAGALPEVLRREQIPRYFEATASELVVAADDAQADPRTAELNEVYLRPLGIRSMMDVPVRVLGSYIGMLCHEHVGTLRQWSVQDQNFASAVAMQVALAYERDRSRQAQLALLQRTLYDPLTQLPNNVYFEDALAQTLAQRVAGAKVAVLMADVDQFRLVCEGLGAAQADLLLAALAQRLREASPADSLLAKVGIDQFALLLTGPGADAGARRVADRWRGELTAPLLLGGKPIFLTLSTGFSARAVDESADGPTLLREASSAMQHAKVSGGGRVRAFAAHMHREARERLDLEQDLRRALDAREFRLLFQPLFDLDGNGCVGAEALLRWQHPHRGLVAPAQFIDVAIDAGLMVELGRRIVRAACEGLAQLQRRCGDSRLRLAVNLSAPEILEPGTAALAYTELARAGVAPQALTIEVTETVLVRDLDGAERALRELKAGGIRICLDDFGTAYSSLTWLRRLPIDALKIDRSFVADIPRDHRNVAIVRTMVDLAHALGQQVIAEGIEHQDQLDALRMLGIHTGQGFLFAPGVTAEQWNADWLREVDVCRPVYA